MSTFTVTFKEMAQYRGAVIGVNEYDPRWYGLADYPLYDETHRDTLNKKIIDHFWNREIGYESIEMMVLAVKRKMNEYMPYVNEHYRISALTATLDPLQTVNVETSANNTGNSTSKSDTTQRIVASDHPQELLAANGDYATNSNDLIGETTGTGTNTGTSDQITKGASGHAASLAMAARQAIVNVDMLVINELESLFMQVWASWDEFGNYGGYYDGCW